jgi:enamine deaminase RidA (YjgF/YER057c/UK114 family)
MIRQETCQETCRKIGQEIHQENFAHLNTIWRAAMAGIAEKRLGELGVVLPEAAAPVANYVAFVRSGNLLMVSGQICLAAGKLVAKGQLGADVSIEDGQKAARACAVNVLAQVKSALGDLDQVARVVRLGGFVNAAPGFLEGPKVMNGASDLMVAVFGDKGKHARTTVGVSALPLDAAMEVEALFEVI